MRQLFRCTLLQFIVLIVFELSALLIKLSIMRIRNLCNFPNLMNIIRFVDIFGNYFDNHNTHILQFKRQPAGASTVKYTTPLPCIGLTLVYIWKCILK